MEYRDRAKERREGKIEEIQIEKGLGSNFIKNNDHSGCAFSSI